MTKLAHCRSGWVLALVAALLAAPLAVAAPPPAEPGLELSVRLEAQNAVQRGVEFLVRTQAADGGWADHPGISAVCLVALARAPHPDAAPLPDRLTRARAFLLQHVQRDGAIVNAKARDNVIYSTSVGVMALSLLGRAEDTELILRGRAYLVRAQDRSGFEYQGLGYQDARYPDLSNTHWAIEALHVSEARVPASVAAAERERTAQYFRRAVKLISDCQAPATHADAGGFLYYPLRGQPPVAVAHPDLPGDRAWGSLSFGGVKSLVYAGVERGDERVTRGLAWLGQHYSLKENTGLGQGGLYYGFYMMATTCSVLQVEKLTDATGAARDWRSGLAGELLARQQTDGRWVNGQRLWLEDNPALCTAYALLALELLLAER